MGTRRSLPILGGGAAGFTLLELVIALSLVGIIAVLLFGGLRLGGRFWERVDQVGERAAGMSSAQALLRRTLGQARLTYRILDEEQVVSLFSGNSGRLDFVAALSRHVGLPGLYLLRLQAVGSDAGQQLVLTRWLLHPEVLAGEGGNPRWSLEEVGPQDGAEAQVALDVGEAEGAAFGRTQLLEGLDAVTFSYYGQKQDETEPAWHEDWIGQQALPRLVRIRLVQTGHGWPDLVVAPSGT